MKEIKLKNIELGDTGAEAKDKINQNDANLRDSILSVDNKYYTLDKQNVKKENISQILGSSENLIPTEKAVRDALSQYPKKNEVALGTILKGNKANEAEIKSIPLPDIGDTYRALDTNHYWTFDGMEWNDLGSILPNDAVTQSTICNVSQLNNNYTYPDKQSARNAVPLDKRAKGQIITYELSLGTQSKDITNEFKSYIDYTGKFPDEKTGRIKVWNPNNLQSVIMFPLKKNATYIITGLNNPDKRQNYAYLYRSNDEAKSSFFNIPVDLNGTFTYNTDNCETYITMLIWLEQNSNDFDDRDTINVIEKTDISEWVTEQFIGLDTGEWEDKWEDKYFPLIKNIKEFAKKTEDLKLELYGGKIEKEIIPYNSGTVPNTTNVRNVYYTYQSKIRETPIKQLKIKCLKAGTLSILIGKNIGNDNFTQKIISVITLKEGDNLIPVNITLDIDEYIGFWENGDTCQLLVEEGPNPIGNGYYYRRINENFWRISPASNLGIGITIRKEIKGDINKVSSEINIKLDKLSASTPTKENHAKFYEPWLDGNQLKVRIPNNLKERLILNDEPYELITKNSHDITYQQEATMIEIDGEYRIYYTGVLHNNAISNRICYCTIDLETKKIINHTNPIIGLGYGGAPIDREANCSHVFKYKDYIYCVATDGYGVANRPSDVYLYKSKDGINFSQVKKLNNSSIPWSFHGNNWITVVNDEFYWFYEGRDSGQIWRTGVAKANSIDGEYQNIGIIPNLGDNNGMYGGICVLYHKDLFRMFYHYGIGGDLPTVLGYAEASISDLPNFTRKYAPLLDLKRKPWGDKTDQIADPTIHEFKGNTYMIAEYTTNYPIFKSRMYLWEAKGLNLDMLFD